jgi:hypothetical protein
MYIIQLILITVLALPKSSNQSGSVNSGSGKSGSGNSGNSGSGNSGKSGSGKSGSGNSGKSGSGNSGSGNSGKSGSGNSGSGNSGKSGSGNSGNSAPAPVAVIPVAKTPSQSQQPELALAKTPSQSHISKLAGSGSSSSSNDMLSKSSDQPDAHDQGSNRQSPDYSNDSVTGNNARPVWFYVLLSIGCVAAVLGLLVGGKIASDKNFAKKGVVADDSSIDPLSAQQREINITTGGLDASSGRNSVTSPKDCLSSDSLTKPGISVPQSLELDTASMGSIVNSNVVRNGDYVLPIFQ